MVSVVGSLDGLLPAEDQILLLSLLCVCYFTLSHNYREL